jgi:hypothetical protein
MHSSLPTTAELRDALVRRALAYCGLKNIPLSTLGKSIAGDPGLFFRIQEGQNITLKTYDKIRKWFDKNWPK